MPKKGRKASVRGGDSCVIPFHTFLSTALSGGGLLSFVLAPNNTVSPRVTIEADAWAHFRVRQFAFRLHPSAAAVTGIQQCGYVGGVQDTTPATSSAIGELLPSCVLAPKQSVPTEWVRCSKSELAGPLPWYKTVPGAADPTEESPGAVALVGGLTDVVNLEMRGTFEFKTAVATANTPMAMSAIASLREERIRGVVNRERELLLKLLAPPQVTKSMT